MNKTIRVILIDEADSEYKRLNEIVGQQIKEGNESSQEMQLLRSIRQKTDFIKVNPFYGDNIAKEKIPKEYDVKNLWRVELQNFGGCFTQLKGIKSKLFVLCLTF